MRLSQDHAPHAGAVTSGQSPAWLGDLTCPLCGEPVELRLERTEDGAEQVGRCANCIAIVEIN